MLVMALTIGVASSVDVQWASPVLVEGPGPSDSGPPVPDHFFGFDGSKIYGPGKSG